MVGKGLVTGSHPLIPSPGRRGEIENNFYFEFPLPVEDREGCLPRRSTGVDGVGKNQLNRKNIFRNLIFLWIPAFTRHAGQTGMTDVDIVRWPTG
jgi:hypothetical protein